MCGQVVDVCNNEAAGAREWLSQKQGAIFGWLLLKETIDLRRPDRTGSCFVKRVVATPTVIRTAALQGGRGHGK